MSNRRVCIECIPSKGLSRMIDLSDNKILVELYDDRIDQEIALIDLAEGLGYVVVEEVYGQ